MINDERHPTPCKAIKMYCKEVCGDVAECDASNCPLYPFREGRNPNRAKPHMQPRKPQTGEFSTVYTGDSKILRGITDKPIAIPEGYEIIVRKKKQ